MARYREKLVHWSEVQVTDFNTPAPERKLWEAEIATERGSRKLRRLCHGEAYFKALGFTVLSVREIT